MSLSPSLNSNSRSTTPSTSIAGATLETANIKELPVDVVAELDRQMAESFIKYTWLKSPEERDVDFVIARLNGEIIGRAAVVTRDALLDGKPITILGLGGVLVDEEYRGHGLGNELNLAAIKIIHSHPIDFCILMCKREPLEDLYLKAGFRTVLGGRNPIFPQPDCKESVEYRPGEGITMVHEKNGKVWPGGLLDLIKYPF